MKKELQGLEEHLDSLSNTEKKIPNWKTPGHDDIHGFWNKKFISIHIRQAIEMNRYLEV